MALWCRLRAKRKAPAVPRVGATPLRAHVKRVWRRWRPRFAPSSVSRTPRSVRAVLAGIGIADWVARNHCRELYLRLSAAHASGGAERRERIERLDAALRAEARLSAPRSPHAVLQQLGVSQWFALAHCADAYSLLVDAEGARSARRAQRIAEVEAALRCELRKSCPRSPNAVAKALGVGHWYAKRYCREAYELLRDAHAAHPRSATRRQREVACKRAQRDAAAAESRALARRVRDAVLAELRRATPRSPRAVLKTFGVVASYAQRHCPEAYARLRDARAPGGRLHRGLVEPLDAALRAEAGRVKPRSPHALLKEHPVSWWFLQRYCSEALALLREARASSRRKSGR